MRGSRATAAYGERGRSSREFDLPSLAALDDDPRSKEFRTGRGIPLQLIAPSRRRTGPHARLSSRNSSFKNWRCSGAATTLTVFPPSPFFSTRSFAHYWGDRILVMDLRHPQSTPPAAARPHSPASWRYDAWSPRRP